jgi:hypothetical protein
MPRARGFETRPALAVLQPRYWLAYGKRAGTGPAAQGHSYL